MNKYFIIGTLVLALPLWTSAADINIVFLAGGASHGPGDHEHRAGCLLLQRCLAGIPGVHTEVFQSWPKDESAIKSADAVIVFSDGDDGNPVTRPERLKLLNAIMERGAGFACIHYATTVPQPIGEQYFLPWMGGYYLTNWSVNPTWTPHFNPLPKHPVTQGVKPFSIQDEWYYHMRFVDKMKGVTPILSALPPKDTIGGDGPHSGNPAVREAVKQGESQVLLWVYERPQGGRGFGFTGAHFHKNWGEPDFRKVVLNAILWIAKMEVPAQGVMAEITPADLNRNLDQK
jgi:hypothetical protein